jgi:hypothetical protein
MDLQEDAATNILGSPFLIFGISVGMYNFKDSPGKGRESIRFGTIPTILCVVSKDRLSDAII